MKRVIASCVFALIAMTVHAQMPVDAGTNKITYLDVVTASKLKAKDIFSEAEAWGEAQGFKEIDREEGESIKFSGSVKPFYPSSKGGVNESGTVTFTVQIFAKDGKYRYIITDLYHKGKLGNGGKLENKTPDCGSSRVSVKGWNVCKTHTDKLIKELIADLIRVMKEKENDPALNDDW